MNSENVIVCGGGPAGIGAAVAAGRLGARVTLIERHPMLGGMGTAALVSNFCPAHYDRRRFIIDGVFGDLRRRLIARGALYAIQPEHKAPRMEPYDPDVFAEEAAALCRNAGVDVRLNSRITDAVFTSGAHAVMTLDDGSRIRGAQIVDATADAVIAAFAGVKCTNGHRESGMVMPLSLCYLMQSIDLETVARDFPEAVSYDPRLGEHYFYYSGNNPRVHDWVMTARRRGELTIPAKGIAAIMSIPGKPTTAMVNFGRVDIDQSTDPEQLATATRIGRCQAEEGISFFRKYIPGMAKVDILRLARQIGVRESRQIVGQTMLTGKDVRACRQFDDCIAQCCYAIDVHHKGSDKTLLEPFAPGRHFDIPWRCLVPAEGPRNLVVAGRCISAEREAMSSFRVSPSCMAIGQAAGVGAALAARTNGAIDQVDFAEIRDALLDQGAILT